jgi:hypothetical protein
MGRGVRFYFVVGFVHVFMENLGFVFLAVKSRIFCHLFHFLVYFISIFLNLSVVLFSFPLSHLTLHYFHSQQFVDIGKNQFKILFYKFVFETGADYTVGTVVALRKLELGNKEGRWKGQFKEGNLGL